VPGSEPFRHCKIRGGSEKETWHTGSFFVYDEEGGGGGG